MKTRLLIMMFVFSLLFSITPITHGVLSNEYSLGIVEWQYDCHPLVFNTGLVRVIDQDMNFDDNVPDRFDIEVLSDYNENNIQQHVNPIHTVIETGSATGIFESILFWGDPHDEGIGHRVPIWDNSTVTAMYADNTLPSSYLDLTLDITSSMIVKDVKPIKNPDGSSDLYYIYEPCTVELWDMKNDPKYTVEHDFIFLPPLKQFKSGISIDEIQCKESLTLVTKHDGSSACIKPDTKQKLIERGWHNVSKINEKNSTKWQLEEYTIPIKLDNVILDYIRAEYHNQKILMYVTIVNDDNPGEIKFTFPKQAVSMIFDKENCPIFDESSDMTKFNLRVNQEFKETFDVSYLDPDKADFLDQMMLSIQVPVDSSMIEVMSTCGIK